MIEITTRIGAHSIKISGNDLKEVLKSVSFLGELPGSCGKCNSQNLAFHHRNPQGYDFFSLLCRDCSHELRFGTKKDDGLLFPKGNWEPRFQSQENPAH